MSINVKGKTKELVGKVKDVYTDVTTHWNKPAKNKYVPYKEVINYSFGGMGIQCVCYVLSFLGLGVGSTLVGSTIGIRPMHLQYMAMLQSIIALAFPIIRGAMVDNTRTKYGRFRPYLALSGVPLVLMCALYMWLPFDTMTYSSKLLATFCFSVAITFVGPLFTDTYGELGSCLTPDTAERTNIFAISSIIFSFAPTIYYTFVPMLSNFTGGFTNINTYKFVIIPVGIIGALLSLFAAFGCKERVVTSKNYVQKVGLIEGVKAVYKNKYWWIRTIATIVGFMEMAWGAIFTYIYIYGTQDMVVFGLLNTVWGTASGLSMLLTPLILKKLGNKRTLIMHNSLNVVFTTIMLFTFKMPGVYFVIMYLNTFVNNLQIVYNPVLAAEVKDSIQYQSGKRMDFTLGAAFVIISPITMATGFVMPFLYEAMGLTINYDVLYDPMVRNSVFAMLCVCSMIGAALNLIPFFFYNLSREKHQMIILSLKYRAANTDYALGTMNCYQVREIVEMYNNAMDIHNAEPVDVKALRNAYYETLREKAVTDEMRANPDFCDKDKRKAMVSEAKTALKAKRKTAKRAYLDGRKLMENKEAYDDIFAKELMKYDTPLGKVKYTVAKMISDIDIDDLKRYNLDLSTIEYEADAKETHKIEKYLANVSKQFSKMQELINKKYADTKLVNNYWEELKAAIDKPAYTKEEQRAHDKEVTIKEKAFKLFNKEFKCYLDAAEFVKDKDNTNNFDKYILPMYEESVKQAEEEDRLHYEKEAREKAEHKAEIERIRAERRAKRLAKKGIVEEVKADEVAKDTEDIEAEEVTNNEAMTDDVKTDEIDAEVTAEDSKEVEQ